jgi:capsule polysaccharide modification protein KpsS
MGAAAMIYDSFGHLTVYIVHHVYPTDTHHTVFTPVRECAGYPKTRRHRAIKYIVYMISLNTSLAQNRIYCVLVKLREPGKLGSS